MFSLLKKSLKLILIDETLPEVICVTGSDSKSVSAAHP
jgi:hypothetical protein